MAEPTYYESVILASLSGISGDTTWPDYSPHHRLLSAGSGTVKDIASTPIAGSGRSAQFSGVTPYLTPAVFSLDMGTSDFTIRMWVLSTAGTTTQGLCNLAFGNGSAPIISRNNSNQLAYRGTAFTTNTIVTNTWTHVEVTRAAGVVRGFIDGALQANTIADSTNLDGITGLRIGIDGTVNSLSGNMCDFQIIKGIALHTASFTRPAVRMDVGTLPVNNKFLSQGVKLQAGAVALTGVMKYAPAVIKLFDIQWGGKGRISGTTKLKGTPTNTPLSRKVRLYNDRDGVLIREMWSDNTTGAYSFDNIDLNQRYSVITYDYQHAFRAVVADNLTPDPMP